MDVCSAAARSGNLEMLKWCIKHGDSSWKLEDYTMRALIERGNFNVVEWAIDNGYRTCSGVLSQMARRYPLATLKFYRNKGYTFNEYICRNVLASGNIDIVKWFREIGKCRWEEKSYCDFFNNEIFLKWLDKNGCEFPKYIANQIAYRGNVESLKYCKENGLVWNDKLVFENIIIGFSLRKNHQDFEILKYGFKICGIWPPYTTGVIAKSGNIEALKYCVENGATIGNKVCRNAAISGTLEMLKYCKEIGGKLDNQTSINALMNYNFRMLKWLKENDCPFDEDVEKIYQTIQHS